MSVWRDQLLHLLSCILCTPATVFPLSLLTPLSCISSSLFLPPFCFVFFLYFLLHSTSLCIFPSSLSCRPFYLSILAPQERNAVIFLLLPKHQLESIGLIKVKGKGLKRKVFHASCEWYAGAENGKVPSVFFLPIPLLLSSLCLCDIVTAPLWVSSRDEVSDLSVD